MDETKIGIVGNGADKFTDIGAKRAQKRIRQILLEHPGATVVSGHSPLGGVDIWAEEIAAELGYPTDIKTPEVHQWNPDGYGYKARNLDIAKSDIVHVIVADEYPFEYEGRRFKSCYHCKDRRDYHVKSGGCWTGLKADLASWHIIQNS